MPRVASPAAAHIGAQIRRVRDDKEWTQDQLAAATGIDSSNIRAYESGRSLANVHSIVRIATAMGVHPGELLDGLQPEMFPMRADDARRRSATHRASGSSAA